MWFNGLVALLTILVPAVWSTKGRGFGAFSSLLAAVGALCAGGIAFAVWEPTAWMIMGWGAGSSGFVGNLLQGSAFALGLAGPFLVSLLVIRLLTDAFVKANIDLGEMANMIGGALFGVVTGVVSVGILVISVGHLQAPASIMGYAPIEERSGQPVYANRLWIPVDLAVARLYEHLSLYGFASRTPLARHHPDVHVAAGMQRITYRNASRNTIYPDQFSILGAYTISGPVDDLSRDTFIVDPQGQTKRQQVFYPDGSSPSGSATLHGYVMRFTSGAKERGGNVVLTPGQLRLICVDEAGDALAVHPVAVISPPEAGSTGLYRFRFDAPEGFIASIGGGADSVLGFEFIVPQGYEPRDLLVRNARVNLGTVEAAANPRSYPTSLARDNAVRDASIFTAFGASVAGAGVPLDTSGSTAVGRAGSRVEGVEQGAHLPGGMVLNKSNRGTLSISEKNEIVEGDHTFDKAQLQERALERSLRVEKFAIGADTGIIKVELSRNGARTIFGRAVEAAESTLVPLLVDERGTQYEPVGFVYEEGTTARIRYTPGQPLRALAEAPALSRTKRDQTLVLIFRPTRNVRIMGFAIGRREIYNFKPDGILVRE